jgi:hypothetical protein
MLSTAPQDQAYCLVLLKSHTGKMEKVYIAVLEGQTPEDFMEAVANAYKTHIDKAKRLFYRCVLLKRAVISTATLFKASTPLFPLPSQIPLSSSNPSHQINNLGLGTAPGHDLVIKDYVHDHTLTSALREPAMLSGVDPDSFFDKYKDIIVDAGSINTPSAAILIYLEDDPVAAKICGILCSVISLAAGLAARIAF